jgi:hypothetical protein
MLHHVVLTFINGVPGNVSFLALIKIIQVLTSDTTGRKTQEAGKIT